MSIVMFFVGAFLGVGCCTMASQIKQIRKRWVRKKQLQREQKIWQNIENYGTGRPQWEVNEIGH